MEILYTDGLDSRFLALCRELDQDLNRAVGGVDQRDIYTPLNLTDATFSVVILTENGIPCACGSFKKYKESTAEIKRIYTKSAYRGRGFATFVLAELEKLAVSEGYRELVLETGRMLESAIALYQRLGYREIPNYGPYIDMPRSICFQKDL